MTTPNRQSTSSVNTTPVASNMSETGQGVRCPLKNCNKLFRNEKLLQMHVKHYHPEYNKLVAHSPSVTDLAFHRTRLGQNFQDFETSGSLLENLKRAERKVERQISRCGGQERKPNNKVVGKQGSSMTTRQSEPSESPAKKGKQEKEKEKEKEREDKKGLKKRKLSLGESKSSEGVTQPEKKIKTLMPQKKSESLGSLESVVPEVTAEAGPSQVAEGVEKKGTRGRPKRESLTDAPPKLSIKSEPTIAAKTRAKRSRNDSILSVGSEATPTHATPPPSPPSAPPPTTPPTFRVSGRRQQQLRHRGKAEKLLKMTEEKKEVKDEKKEEEEVVNCGCGRNEEDGLMVQCDICLCWQHGLCLGIHKEEEVPDKYICAICRNPKLGRQSVLYTMDQDWLKEGRLPSLPSSPPRSPPSSTRPPSIPPPSSRPSPTPPALTSREAEFKKLSDLMADLTNLSNVLHSLRVKLAVAGQATNPKLFMWSSLWESSTPATPPPSHFYPGAGHNRQNFLFPTDIPDNPGDFMADSHLALQHQITPLVHQNMSLQQQSMSLQQQSMSLQQQSSPLQQQNTSLELRNSHLMQQNLPLMQQNNSLSEQQNSSQQQNNSVQQQMLSLKSQPFLDEESKSEDMLSKTPNTKTPEPRTDVSDSGSIVSSGVAASAMESQSQHIVDKTSAKSQHIVDRSSQQKAESSSEVQHIVETNPIPSRQTVNPAAKPDTFPKTDVSTSHNQKLSDTPPSECQQGTDASTSSDTPVSSDTPHQCSTPLDSPTNGCESSNKPPNKVPEKEDCPATEKSSRENLTDLELEKPPSTKTLTDHGSFALKSSLKGEFLDKMASVAGETEAAERHLSNGDIQDEVLDGSPRYDDEDAHSHGGDPSVNCLSEKESLKNSCHAREDARHCCSAQDEPVADHKDEPANDHKDEPVIDQKDKTAPSCVPINSFKDADDSISHKLDESKTHADESSNSFPASVDNSFNEMNDSTQSTDDLSDYISGIKDVFDFPTNLIPSVSEVQRLLPGVIQSVTGGGLEDDDGSLPDFDRDVTSADFDRDVTSCLRRGLGLPPPNVIPEPKRLDREECRMNLIQHIENVQGMVEERFDKIEARLMALEANEEVPPLDETDTHFPQTKTVLTLMIQHLKTAKKVNLLLPDKI